MEPKDPKEKADELLQRCGGAGDKALMEVGLLILEQLEQIAIALTLQIPPVEVSLESTLTPEQEAETRKELEGFKPPLFGAGRAQHIAAVETKEVRERMPKAHPEADQEAQPGG